MSWYAHTYNFQILWTEMGEGGRGSEEFVGWASREVAPSL